MKKLFTALICATMVLGMGGCGNSDETKKEPVKEETKDAVKIMDEAGFSLSCKDTGSDFLCGYKNENTKEAFVYSDNVGLYFQSKKGSFVGIDDTTIISGDESKDSLENQYNDILNNLNLTISDIKKPISKKYKEEYEKSDYNAKNFKGYDSGLYEVGKDINAGEYMLLANEDAQSTSVEVRTNEYSNGDDSIYTDFNFRNNYIKVTDGMFIETDGVTMYKLPDAPKIEQHYAYMVLKVGRDIEPGNYTIVPNSDSNYFSIETRDMDYGYMGDIINNDIDFTTNRKVQLSEGQYLVLEYATVE